LLNTRANSVIPGACVLSDGQKRLLDSVIACFGTVRTNGGS